MIGSHFLQRLKQQHWTGVFIELVIVIIGVFIGTNVTNWNDAHRQHVRAREYTRRLLGDLRVEYEHDLSLRQYDADALEAGTTAFDGLAQRRKLDDRTILINAYRATQFQWYERHRAAFDEMLSSGELDLISDPELRETATRYYGNSTELLEQITRDSRDSEYRRLFRRLIDPDVALTLRKDCGDRRYTPPSGVPGLLTIGYDCKPTVDDSAVRKAVDALRGNADLLPALRHQTAVYDMEIFNLDYMLDDSRIKALFAQDGGK